MIRRAGIVLIGVVLGGGFYLLLIDTTSLPELYVLAGVALGCGVVFQLAREQGFVEAALRPGWLVGIWRLALQIPRDVVFVCGEALVQLVRPKPVRGAFRTTAFTATGQRAQDTGRRALADSLGSVAPNTIVVGIDTEHGLLLVHQLRRGGEARSLDVLRLG